MVRGMPNLTMAFRWLRMPRWNFIRLHYAYILSLTVVCMIALYPARNMPAIDAFFMSVSAATVTGLNTHDLKDMKTYQQIIVYFIPLLGQLQFVNTAVVLVRLYWFERKFKNIVSLSRHHTQQRRSNLEAGKTPQNIRRRSLTSTTIRVLHAKPESHTASPGANGVHHRDNEFDSPASTALSTAAATEKDAAVPKPPDRSSPGHITFSAETYNKPPRDRALRIPGPREFEKGHGVEEVDADSDGGISRTRSVEERSIGGPPGPSEPRVRPAFNRLLSGAVSVERAASSAFVLGDRPRAASRESSRSRIRRTTTTVAPSMPYLSYQPTLGRNSKFQDLTPEQRDELGGVEYRSLRLLSRIVGGYYILFHILAGVCLVIWIHGSNAKYREKLGEVAINPTWWAFYSGMTTFNNLGYTLTPDSMIPFRETTFPILLMIFAMWIGNTAYPCTLRFLIWTMFKLVPSGSALREPLNFLLDHPRRCYTLLFPSGPTWMLLGVLALLNGIDVILFVIIDLNNAEVESIGSGWHRFLAALFQATSSRTTGTSTFPLAKIHIAVQFSLMVMMYISVFPIAMSIRKTNTYEGSSLGIYEPTDNGSVDENKSVSYLGEHIKKQLAFDLWFVFLGVFIILLTEGNRIADPSEDSFQVFAIFFEIMSAYGNVGLSLGHPSINTSMTGKYSTIGKLVICAMMIRGRHRGLPYELDRAIVLPREKHLTDEPLRNEPPIPRIRRYHTR